MNQKEQIMVTHSDDISKMSRRYRRLYKMGKLKTTKYGLEGTIKTVSKEQKHRWFVV